MSTAAVDSSAQNNQAKDNSTSATSSTGQDAGTAASSTSGTATIVAVTGPDVVEEDFALGTPTEHVAVNEEETREPIEAEEVASGDVVEPVAVNSEEMGDPIDAAEVASGDVAEPVAGCMGRPIDAEEVVPGDFAEVNAVDGAAEWIAEPNAAQQAPDDDDMALEVFPDDVAGEVVPENAADVDADMEANVANNNLTHVVNDDDFDLDDGAQSPPVSAELMYMLDSLYALDGAFADCNRTVMAHETLRFVTAGHPADLVTGLREEYLDTIPHVLLPEPLVNFGLHFRLPPGGVVLAIVMYMADPLPDDVLLDMGLDEIVTLRHNPGALPDLIRSVEDLFNLVDPEEFPAPHGLYPRSVLVNLGNITGRRYVGLDISDEVVDHLNMMRVYQNHEPDYLNMPQADDLDMLDD